MDRRQLSPKTRNLIEAIYSKRKRLYLISRNGRNDIQELLEEIEESGEYSAISELLPLLVDKKIGFKEVLATTIHTLFRKTPLLELFWIDQRIRDIPYYIEQNWYEIKPNEVNRLGRYAEYSLVLLGLFSFHPNGYVREAAIHVLNTKKTGEELPFLIIRLNDWVPQISQIAQDAVQNRMFPSYARHFLNCYPLLNRLENCGRKDHLTLIDEINTFLSKKECHQSIIEALSNKDRHIRRACFQLAMKIDGMQRKETTQLAIEDPDPIH